MRVSTPLYHRYSIRYCLTKLSKNIRYRRILSNVLRVFNKRFMVKAEYLAKIFELSWKYRTIVEYHAIIAFITSFFDRENFPSRERLSSIGPLGSFSSSLSFFFLFFLFIMLRILTARQFRRQSILLRRFRGFLEDENLVLAGSPPV